MLCLFSYFIVFYSLDCSNDIIFCSGYADYAVFMLIFATSEISFTAYVFACYIFVFYMSRVNQQNACRVLQVTNYQK